MNALANSHWKSSTSFCMAMCQELRPFTVKRYTGQESKAERSAIANDPPDILLINFMMLEYQSGLFELAILPCAPAVILFTPARKPRPQ
jgi:ATP-dependent helicase YprA (DUF1998 family)